MRKEEEKQSLRMIKSLFNQQHIRLQETVDEYEHYDLYNDRFKIEAKDRRISSLELFRYADEGFIAEDYKLQYLDDNDLYVNTIYNKKIILVWKVKDIRSNKSSKQWCPSTTDFKNNEYKDKKVKYLQLEQGTIFFMKDKKWNLIKKEDLFKNIYIN